MSLLATSYRYENESSRFSHKAFKGQNVKSKRDEKYATGKKCDTQNNNLNMTKTHNSLAFDASCFLMPLMHQIKLVRKGSAVAEAIKSPEKLEEILDRRKAKRDKEILKEELKYEKKSLILLRRSKLCTLLMEEYISYEKDLTKQGKTFYLERI